MERQPKTESEDLIKTSSQEIELSPESRFQVEKFKSDLKQGFRITIENETGGEDVLVEVVTRLEDDLFFAMANFGKFPGADYARLNYEVRRRKHLPGEQGSATLEVFKTQKTTLNQNGENFRIQSERGGSLEEPEFWRRYNTSVPDRELTKQYSEFRQQEITRSYKGVSKDVIQRSKFTLEEDITDQPFPDETKLLNE